MNVPDRTGLAPDPRRSLALPALNMADRLVLITSCSENLTARVLDVAPADRRSSQPSCFWTSDAKTERRLSTTAICVFKRRPD
jgi:hypothetical protein